MLCRPLSRRHLPYKEMHSATVLFRTLRNLIFASEDLEYAPPRRSERDNPPSDFEKSIAKMRFTNDGGEVFHVYNGHDVDSYRTEVIGIIVSMGRHCGLNFLLDNYSAMEGRLNGDYLEAIC